MDRNKDLSISEFYLWRVLVAIAWADGDFGHEEMDFFSKVFDNLVRYYQMTDEQRAILAEDLELPRKVEDLVAYINDPEIRNVLISYAEDLVMLDGQLDANEEEILKHLHLWHAPSYDKTALLAETKVYIARQREKNAEEKRAFQKQAREANILFVAVDRVLQRLGLSFD